MSGRSRLELTNSQLSTELSLTYSTWLWFLQECMPAQPFPSSTYFILGWDEGKMVGTGAGSIMHVIFTTELISLGTVLHKHSCYVSGSSLHCINISPAPSSLGEFSAFQLQPDSGFFAKLSSTDRPESGEKFWLMIIMEWCLLVIYTPLLVNLCNW